MSKHFLSASIVLLSIAIMLFAFQLGKSNNADESIKNVKVLHNGLLTSEEVAAYLRMDVDEFDKLIKNQNLERATYSSYDTYKFIPYLQMNGNNYFTKDQVDEWVNYNILNWQSIQY